MRNIDNVLTDIVSKYKFDTLEYTVIQSNEIDGIWVVEVRNKSREDSFLKIEILNNDGIPACCVLERRNVGYSSMSAFMNRLVDALE